MRKILVFAGLLTTPTAPEAGKLIEAKVPAPKQDPRPVLLKHFFDSYDCPLAKYASEFVKEADENALDWRLLPSISFIESSGGKYLENNNAFGWNSCKTRFPTIREGIHHVAKQLGRSTTYRNKTLEQVLKTYNPRPEYTIKVKDIMKCMGQNTGRPGWVPVLVGLD